MSYVLHLIIYFEIYAIFALSLNLVVGYCGLLTLAHAAYFAIGAYGYAILTVAGHVNSLTAASISCLIAFAASAMLSFPAQRLRGDSFVIATLAVQVAVTSTLNNWFSVNSQTGTLSNLTNGPFGIGGIPTPHLLGFAFDSKLRIACLAGALLSITMFLLGRLLTSPWGRLVTAMRDDELALRGLGKNTTRAKVEVFGVSCVVAALAGCIYAGYVRYVNPSNASFDENVLALMMVLVGGTGNVRGPLIGAALLTALPELLRILSFPDGLAPNLRLLLFGLLLGTCVHFRSQGLAGKIKLK